MQVRGHKLASWVWLRRRGRQRRLKKEFCKTNYEACAGGNEMEMGILVIMREKN